VLEQVEHEPAEILTLRGELLDERERPGRILVDDEIAKTEQRLLLDRPSSCSTACTVIWPSVAAESWSSVETASRNEPRAPRAISDSAWSGTSMPSPSATRPQQLHELGETWPLEDERLTARANRRQHLREIGRAEDEDEVRRRLFDQLQQCVPRGVGELVRLVEDVDLVAALGRLQHDALADLADVVDAALRRRVHLDDVE
jgi:hypothetical protein